MDLLNTLKINGYRITKSRKLICELLESDIHFHFNVKQLHQKINLLSKLSSGDSMFRHVTERSLYIPYRKKKVGKKFQSAKIKSRQKN